MHVFYPNFATQINTGCKSIRIQYIVYVITVYIYWGVKSNKNKDAYFRMNIQ
jgi:hypothetical protein